ncbi:hypothetical protein PLEOSDRAFT_165803 [Pleurotus ostreatus PC15]|uniref:Uncharacterized protein n=2 Tax=Pleurotus TaxID=5320 RepID=A0A067NQH3_PLEO1|nr:hypothetical protein CCMSSC00406_0006975 [Pleurotus cornucopiae]KDQ30199.1 hypothetical protein PLEOSDRAFT_165803 [Pleurotus ostreatus PC15]
MIVKKDKHEENTEAVTDEGDMNGDYSLSNAKAAVGGDEEDRIDSKLGVPPVLDAGIIEENNRCNKKLRHADLNASTSTAINSERIDSGAKPSAALLSIMNDDTIDTRTKLERMVEEDRGVLQWRVGGPVEYRDKGNERERPRPKPPARPQHKLGRQDGPHLGEPSRPSHSRLLQLLHPQWRTRKRE